LWFFLLTGPHTGPVPGLFRAGRAAMAEELDWELEAFDEAFAEAFDEGMVKADFKSRLVWLPNALNHNKPESPNVVRSWKEEIDLLPECDLKTEALVSIRAILACFSDALVNAFDEINPSITRHTAGSKPSPKPSPKPSKISSKISSKALPNQEQEQEQEQETTVLLHARETENSAKNIDMPSAMDWVMFFVNKKSFQIHEAQTAKTVPMFVQWNAIGVTRDDVELAIVAANNALNGSRPSNPMYYRKFVEQVMTEKQKIQSDLSKSNSGSMKTRGNYDGKHGITQADINSLEF
jgi:hypothetical protein